MNTLDASTEFMGRFGISFKERESVYAYDEITHGLYEFTLGMREVNMILPPESIHRNNTDRIIGISKIKNVIILIPLFSNSEWIFYNEEEKVIRYETIIENKVRISSAITIEKNLFLIPSYINEPVIIVSLDCMTKIKTYENWYKRSVNKLNCDTSIWGASCYRNIIAFPIVYSKNIVFMNYDEINVIMPDIPESILSSSVYGDKIWILPASGRYIYSTSYSGNVLDKIDLTEASVSTDRFCRIAATEAAVFLLPNYGENIYAYQSKKKRFAQIKTKSTCLRGSMFLWLTAPYWDFIVENGMLHLLPTEYRYKEIHISSLESREYGLYYGDNINEEKYWKTIRYVQKKAIEEKGRNDLEDFFQYVLFTCEKYFVEENKEIGEIIWINTMEI